MKNINLYISIIVSIFTLTSYTAQTTAMNFSGVDCNGNNVNLFQDLDAGKAVVLFYYMPSCGSCPPEATKIQTMANAINAIDPGKVKAYAFPFQNSTTCTYSAGWVVNNNLPLYTPMDSGAVQVAYYGGFGMPTVVLVGGGMNHDVLFSTQNFTSSDTTIMHDLIMNMTAGIKESTISTVEVFPNPTSDEFKVESNSTIEPTFEFLDTSGKSVEVKVLKIEHMNQYVFDTKKVSNGTYYLKVNTAGKIETKKVSIIH